MSPALRPWHKKTKKMFLCCLIDIGLEMMQNKSVFKKKSCKAESNGSKMIKFSAKNGEEKAQLNFVQTGKFDYVLKLKNTPLGLCHFVRNSNICLVKSVKTRYISNIVRF